MIYILLGVSQDYYATFSRLGGMDMTWVSMIKNLLLRLQEAK